MREILFRGKSVNDGRWIYGDLSNYGDYRAITTTRGFSIIDSCEVIPETVGQYTGLTDKNGKRVFEADILSLQCADEKLRPYPVYFGTYNVESTYGDDFHIGLYTKFFGEDISLGFLADSNGSTDFEVIGNIFDNSLEELQNGMENGRRDKQ